MSVEKIARIFKVLSSPTRLRMIEILKKKSLCVNGLAGRLKVSAAAVSQHLRVLREAGVVKADKKGYYVHYSLDDRTLAKWRKTGNKLLGTGN